MATRRIYVTISIDLVNDNVDEITDEMVEEFTEECEYNFPDTDNVKVADSVWCHTDY